MKPEILAKVALLSTILAVVTASTEWESDSHSIFVEEENGTTYTDTQPLLQCDFPEIIRNEGRGKKEEKMFQEIIQAMMLAKNMIAFALMFVSPVLQIKGFGLSVVNTLINIGRFLIQLQATQQMKQMHLAHLKVHYDHAHQTHDSEDLWSSGSNSRYAYYAPPPRQPLGQDHADPALSSYTPLGQQPTVNTHVYPHYSSDVSRMR